MQNYRVSWARQGWTPFSWWGNLDSSVWNNNDDIVGDKGTWREGNVCVGGCSISGRKVAIPMYCICFSAWESLIIKCCPKTAPMKQAKPLSLSTFIASLSLWSTEWTLIPWNHINHKLNALEKTWSYAIAFSDLKKTPTYTVSLSFPTIPGRMGEKVLSEKLHFCKDKICSISQSYLQILEPVVFPKYSFS